MKVRVSLDSKDTRRAPMAREGIGTERQTCRAKGRKRDDQRADSGTEINRRQLVSNHQPIRDQISTDASWTSGWIKRNASGTQPDSGRMDTKGRTLKTVRQSMEMLDGMGRLRNRGYVLYCMCVMRV